jgi:hypothetical protein
MGPRAGFWVALAIVLFYLIARPHVGTVWHVAMERPPGPAPNGFVEDTPAPERFPDRRDCSEALSRFDNASATSAYCAPENALLWGW